MTLLRAIGTSIAGLCLFFCVAATTPRAARAAAGTPSALQVPAAPAKAIPEQVNIDQRQYADREARSPQLAAFKGGGGGVYIGGSAVAVVLVVVLIVVLL
jgi:hypothetical protein